MLFRSASLWHEIQELTKPLSPEGFSTDATGVGDLESLANVKAMRARKAVDTTLHLLGQDILTASYWLDLRKAQNTSRSFGPGPNAALAAFRKVVPFQQKGPAPNNKPAGLIAYEFMKATPATSFYPAGMAPVPADPPIVVPHGRK